MKCPECGEKMVYYHYRGSACGLNRIHQYGCDDCGGHFEVKRISKKGRELIDRVSK